MISIADAAPGDENAIAVLLAELDAFYGDAPAPPSSGTLPALLSSHADDPVIQKIGAQRGKAPEIMAAEIKEWLSLQARASEDERAAVVRKTLFGDPPLACALLAWDGHSLAGLASYSFLWPAVGLTASLYLKELYVAEDYRRTGTGGLLMGGLQGVAERRGLSRVEWTTDTSNAGAQAFYEALGAEPLQSKIFYRTTGAS